MYYRLPHTQTPPTPKEKIVLCLCANYIMSPYPGPQGGRGLGTYRLVYIALFSAECILYLQMGEFQYQRLQLLNAVVLLGHSKLIHCFPFPACIHFMSRIILYIMRKFVHYEYLRRSDRSCERLNDRAAVFQWLELFVFTPSQPNLQCCLGQS